MGKINVYQIRLKVFLLKDILLEKMFEKEAEFIDQVLAKEEDWLQYHEAKHMKAYTFAGLYPLEKGGVYKKENIYTITIRTVDKNIAMYLSDKLSHHENIFMKGLITENSIVPKKWIEEIYTLSPVILKTEKGYWRKNISLAEYERLLFENVIKKYNEFTGEKIKEDFSLYTHLEFTNRTPIKCAYKDISLLGDKLILKISDDSRAQELAYFLLGVSLGHNSSRGYGYCHCKWL